MDIRAIKQQALKMARRALAKLEEQAAGYSVLDIPVNLFIALDEKRKEVKQLEYLLAGKKAESFPNTLPRQEPFFGREKEIESALEALSPQVRSWGVVIDGIGGIGKTALAIETAHICCERNLFDAFLFSTAKRTRLNSEGEQPIPYTSITLADMVSELSRPFGESQIDCLISTKSQRGLLDELQTFSGPERRVLLILDNLETLSFEENREIIYFLSRLPQYCKAIITSRRRIGDGATWLRLESLEWEAARELIEEKIKRSANLKTVFSQVDPSRWQELYDAAGGSPLALNITLELMSKRNLVWDRAIELLRTGASNDAPLFEFIYREARQELGFDDWRILGTLTLPPYTWTFKEILLITNFTQIALESALERLHAFSLIVVQSPSGPYCLHPLTRQLVQHEINSQPEFAQALLPPPVFIFPPTPPAIWIGRESDVKGIWHLLESKSGKNNVVVVRGWPGVGKTTLVSVIGHDPEIVKVFPQGVLFTSLELRPNLLSEIARWGRALGTDETLRLPTLKEATVQLAALLRHRRMLLIVDDVWDTAYALPFIQAMGEQCALLVTTRLTSVAEALTSDEEHIYNLPGLTEESALALLRIFVPAIVAQHEDECRELVRDLDCLPLALHVAGSLLRRQAKMGWGIDDLIREIRGEASLIQTAAPLDRIAGEKIPTVSALLTRSTDMLDEFTRDCFAILGVFAPTPATFDLEAMKTLWEVDDPKPIVRRLVGHGLLEPVGSGRFQMSRLLVAHAKSLLN
jgi:DNA replication protein DnaC